MAKASKVDTKALEELNGNTPQDMSQANSDPITIAVEHMQDIIALFGTTEYQAENIARQFVSSAQYLTNGKTRQLNWDEENVRKMEDRLGHDDPATEEATYAVAGMQRELADLLRLRFAAIEAYETMIGKKYEPLPPKKAPKRIETPQERLAAARAARGK